MGYLSRVWMAAGVAAVQGRQDRVVQATVQRAKDRLVSTAGLIVPAAGLGAVRGGGGGGGGGAGAGEEVRRHADESLRKAMYLSCWGPS